MKRIAIIGIGGRTGSMFGEELKANNSVFGIGREKEIEDIRQGGLFLKKNGEKPVQFSAEMIKDTEFESIPAPEAIFLCTRNPVAPVVKYYYEILKRRGGEMPALFICQNGIAAVDEALGVLQDIFGESTEDLKVARVSLFNSVEREEDSGRVYYSYGLPVRLAAGPVSGAFAPGELEEIFGKTNIEAAIMPASEVKNMERSKLLLNLVGMASASRGLSLEEGFRDKEVFKEEVEMVREYAAAVRADKGKFLDFPHYPAGLLAFAFSSLPLSMLLALRTWIAGKIERGRRGKKKDLGEIDYYNGGVVALARKNAVPAPVNEAIVRRVKEKVKQ
jgi:hypothetical protein